MDKITTFVSIIGIVGTISSIFFAYLALKRNTLQDQRSIGKGEGLMLSDIGYIKACVDRMEKNLTQVDERYRSVIQRLSKVEESLFNTTKRLDEVINKGG